MKENSTLRREGMDALKGRWGSAVLLYIIYLLIAISVGLIPMFGLLINIFIIVPVAYGFVVAFLGNLRSEQSALEVSRLFVAFRGDESGRTYWQILGTQLLTGVYAVLWGLLFIIPGIIKSMSYAMTQYILHDEPELSYNAAIERSMAMMKGYKMKLFLMQLNFMMWYLLSALTLGVALLWIIPYTCSTTAAFYEDVKSNYNN